MASGTSNKLTGQVGEHLVSAVLGTLGYYASPYSGNVPGFDVTAVHSESLKSFPVQVKASTKGALVQSTIDKWCNHSIDENNRQALGELTPLKHPDLIWVLVRLPDSGVSGAIFFICTERDIQKKIVDRYVAFMEKHEYRRPGGGASLQAILNIKDVAEFELRDAAFVIQLLNDDLFIRYIGDKNIRTQEDAINYLKTGPMASYKRHGFGLNLVCLKETHTPIGMCGLLKRDELESPDLGYAFLPEYSGKGYARKAAENTLKTVMKTCSLDKVVAVTLPDNVRSNKLLETIGFRLKETIEWYGSQNNLYEYLG